MVNRSNSLRQISRLCPNRSQQSYEPVRDGVSQTVLLPNGESIGIVGFRFSFLRFILLALISVITLFISLLILSCRRLRIEQMMYRKTNLSQATRILLQVTRTNQRESFTVWKAVLPDGGQRSFTWRHYRFTWSPTANCFQRVHYIDESQLKLSEIHGLIRSVDGVHFRSRREIYGLNQTEVPKPNGLAIFVQILFRPFRLFQLCAVILWALQSYSMYTTIFALIFITELVFKTFMKYKQRSLLRDTSLSSTATVTVLNVTKNERYRILWKDLVPGNVIELDDETTCLCDAVILSGSCLVEESRSKLVHKSQLPESNTQYFDINKHHNHTIFRGSKIFPSRLQVTALVLRTGWATKHGISLSSNLNDTEHSTHNSDKRLQYLYFFLLVCGIGTSIYIVCSQMLRQPTTTWWNLVLTALDLVTICLPPLFPAALTLLNFVGLFRLHRRGFRFSQPVNPSALIHRTATTDSVVFLPGTILSDSKFVPVHSVASESSALLELSMATCHSLILADDDSLVGALDEVQMFPSLGWKLKSTYRIQSMRNHHEIHRITRIYNQDCRFTDTFFKLVRTDPQNSSDASWYFIKGSVPMIMEKIHIDSDAVTSFLEQIEGAKDVRNKVVLFVGRPLDPEETADPNSYDLDRIVNRQFRLLGAVVLRLQTSPLVGATVQELRSAAMRTVLLSRDTWQKTVDLARHVGIFLPKEPLSRIEISVGDGRTPPALSVVDLPETFGEVHVANSVRLTSHMILDGSTLNALLEHFPEMTDQIIGRVSVLSDADEAQMDLFLDRWTKLGKSTLVCRESSDPMLTSLLPSLTLSEKSNVRGFISEVPNVSGLPELIRQCRSALIGSLGLSQCFVCYAVAQLMTTILLLERNEALPNVQYFYIDFGLVLIPTALFGLTKATEDPLSPQIPDRKWLDLRYITSVVVQLALIIGSQWLALMMAQNRLWIPYLSDSVQWTVSDENYAIFSLSLFQYLSLFYIFSSGPPYRQRIWTNFLLTTALVLLASASSMLVLDPPRQIQLWMQIKTVPDFDFRVAVFALALLYFLLSSAVQLVIELLFQRCRHQRPAPDDAAPPNLNNRGSVTLNVVYKPRSLSTRLLTSSSRADWPVFGR